MERRRPAWPCAAAPGGLRSRCSVAGLLLVVLVACSLMAGVADAQSASKKAQAGTNTKAFCKRSCLGKCSKKKGQWTCKPNKKGGCAGGYIRPSSDAPLCDQCAAGYGSALGSGVDPSLAPGFPSCSAAPCSACNKCPLGTTGSGGAMAPPDQPGAAVCRGTGSSTFTQVITTTPDLSGLPTSAAVCPPNADTMLVQYLTNSLYSQGANPGSVEVTQNGICSVVQVEANLYLASYLFNIKYQGSSSIQSNIAATAAASEIDTNTLTGGICSAYYGASGSKNLCQAFNSSSAPGIIITNQGSSGGTPTAPTGTMSLGTVMASTEPCSAALEETTATNVRTSLLDGNPDLTADTSVTPGGCTAVALNASSYVVIGSKLYVYGFGKIYMATLSTQAAAAFPQGGELKIQGINDGTRRLQALDGVDDAVDASGGIAELDPEAAHAIARSLLQLRVPFLLALTSNIIFIFNSARVDQVGANQATSYYAAAAANTVGVANPLAQITRSPKADELLISAVSVVIGVFIAILQSTTYNLAAPVQIDSSQVISLYMGIKSTGDAQSCAGDQFSTLTSSLRSAMVSIEGYDSVTVTAGDCTLTPGAADGSDVIYTVTFGWTGKLASRTALISSSLLLYGPCNLLLSGCQAFSAGTGQDILCVNSPGATCPAPCATGLWRGGSYSGTFENFCGFVEGGYFFNTATNTSALCPVNTYSTSLPVRAARLPEGQACTNCTAGTGTAGATGQTTCTGIPPSDNAPEGYYIDSTGANAKCPGAYTAPFARPASDPTSKFCYPPTNFVAARFLASSTKNKIPTQAISLPAGATSIGCPSGTMQKTEAPAAACGTCPDGYTGDTCSALQPGYYGDTVGGTYGLKLCPGLSSSGGISTSDVVMQNQAASQACTTCQAGAFKSAAGPPAVCTACPDGSTGVPGGADGACGSCLPGYGGSSCSACGGNFATIGLSYVPKGTACSAGNSGCVGGFTGTSCSVPCGTALAADPFTNTIPTGGVGYVDSPDGQSCARGCLKGFGLSADGTSCVACSGNQYSPGAVVYSGTLYSYPRCVTCPSGMSPTDGNSRCEVGRTPATAAGIFDEFD